MIYNIQSEYFKWTETVFMTMQHRWRLSIVCADENPGICHSLLWNRNNFRGGVEYFWLTCHNLLSSCIGRRFCSLDDTRTPRRPLDPDPIWRDRDWQWIKTCQSWKRAIIHIIKPKKWEKTHKNKKNKHKIKETFNRIEDAELIRRFVRADSFNYNPFVSTSPNVKNSFSPPKTKKIHWENIHIYSIWEKNWVKRRISFSSLLFFTNPRDRTEAPKKRA